MSIQRPRLWQLGLASLLWFGICGEVLGRFQGNWRFDRVALAQRPAVAASKKSIEASERGRLSSITYQSGVDPEWFFTPPVAIEKPSHPELVARLDCKVTCNQEENYIWNSAALTDPGTISIIRKTVIDNIFVFPTYDGSALPRYRLYPDNDYRPIAWVTNHWGWLSPDVGLAKPPRTVRVAIIGDSTSHNEYAFYLQSFLNAWSDARRLGVRFEVMNAARQGLGLEDGISTLKYELAPLGPDYVYEYYAPAFSFSMPKMLQWANRPGAAVGGKPPPQLASWAAGVVHTLLDPLADISALARRLRDVATAQAADSILLEPAKPNVRLAAIPPDDPYFKGVAASLDRLKSATESFRAKLLVSTERLCAWDGMGITYGRNRLVFDVVNGPLFWPFSYAQVRQMLNAHNNAIKSWARTNSVVVVDIDGRMPQGPELCEDVHHDIGIARRMRAWLIFQALMPEIAKDLRENRVPAANSVTDGIHPFLDRPIELRDRDAFLAAVDAEAAAKAGSVK